MTAKNFHNRKSYAFCYMHSTRALKYMLDEDSPTVVRLQDVKNRTGYRCSCGKPATMYLVELVDDGFGRLVDDPAKLQDRDAPMQ